VLAVCDFLTEALAEECETISHSEPFLLTQKHVQHICLSFNATLKSTETRAQPATRGKAARRGPGALTNGAATDTDTAASSSAAASHAAAGRVLSLLHPTPAVCGTPRAAAFGQIAAAETFDRGLYAGPFGYASASGCDFCVGIRSALFRGATAHLFAGAGIVRGSEPGAEWEEVHVKMRNFSSLFPRVSRLGRSLLRVHWLRRSALEDFLLSIDAAVRPLVARSTPRPGAALSLPRVAFFAFKVSRPYFYLVTIWLYLIPTGRRADLWASVPFWIGLLYNTMPLNLLTYLMNDLADVEVDSENPRKRSSMLVGVRARGAALRTAVPLTAATQLLFLAAFSCVCGVTRTLLWFSAVVGVNWLYNYGPQLSSNYAPLDLLCPCGYMLVIPLSCALNRLPTPEPRVWVHTLFFIVRSQLWIQTFDLDYDAQAGRRTSAVLLGLKRTQAALAALLLAEAAFVHAYFRDWALRSFSLASFGLLMLQVSCGDRTKKPSPAEIKTTFIVLGLGGYGLLVQVWLNGAFNPDETLSA